MISFVFSLFSLFFFFHFHDFPLFFHCFFSMFHYCSLLFHCFSLLFIDVLSNAFHPSLSVCRLLCATSSSQVISMLVAPSLAVCICCAVGGFIGGSSFNRETPHCSCPDCVVNLSCPAVHCTTGNFEISLTSLIYLGFGLLVTYLIGWAVKRQADCWEPTSQKRASVVDGRRPSLGTSSHWRPGAG